MKYIITKGNFENDTTEWDYNKTKFTTHQHRSQNLCKQTTTSTPPPQYLAPALLMMLCQVVVQDAGTRSEVSGEM